MRLSFWLVVAALLLGPALAAAEARAPMVQPIREHGTAAMGEMVAGPATIDDLRFVRQVLPAIDRPVARAESRIIYLNKTGVTMQVGANDARQNRSTLALQPTTLTGWNPSATTWSSTVACIRELFAAYDVSIVESDPGAVPHIEAVFGGSPAQLGLAANTAGVAPFTQNCEVIENAMVVTFTEVLPNDPRLACEVMAQEIAHAYGLDHEMLASDPMTYLPYNGNRSFQNTMASCGEDRARPCGINGVTCRAQQNSVALLTERLGLKGAMPPGPNTPPTDEEITGGCSTGGPVGLALGLLGLPLAIPRRRRR